MPDLWHRKVFCQLQIYKHAHTKLQSDDRKTMLATHKCEGTVTLKVGQRQMGRSTNHWVKRTNPTQIKKDLKKVWGFRMSVLVDKKKEISLPSKRKTIEKIYIYRDLA